MLSIAAIYAGAYRALLATGKSSQPWRFPLAAFVLFSVSSFVLFWQLGSPSIRMVDESRLAVNALEMALSGDWLVTRFHGQPELYNTKPPLMIWAQAASMLLFGYNEFAVRLPSALSALLTVVLLVFFGRHYFGDGLAALLAGAVLISSAGFTGNHVARTGDYDAMLVLWSTVYSLAYLLWLNGEPRRQRWLWLAAAGLLLAILTKGVAGGLALPGLLAYTLWRKQLGQVLTRPALWAALACVVAGTAGYYLLREQAAPGYLEAVVRNEIAVRYLEAAEGSEASPVFYLKNWLQGSFQPWILLVPIAFGVLASSPQPRVRDFAGFAGCFLGAFLLVITFSRTKLDWYDAPMYPVAALLVGLGLAHVRRYLPVQTPGGPILAALAAALLLIPAQAWVNILPPQIKRETGQTLYGYYLRQFSAAQPAVRRFVLLPFSTGPLQDGPPRGDSRGFDYRGYYAPLLFYQQAWGQRGYAITLRTLDAGLNTGETVLTCDSQVLLLARQKYALQPLHQDGSCSTWQVAAPAL